ncbi:hypothetical protein [Streptomyces luteolus]|uniref:Uncharacterized protein n=1 Tax=Streptomyces luteolus TaxID=3043615 RepID=A0ABT6SZX3_9ACTN|nr:hypothetical protein [Streptomyces sp. B-S-A12]MDI3421158.1 hypothetical protein [Streptomyces sp. B-S-A12]
MRRYRGPTSQGTPPAWVEAFMRFGAGTERTLDDGAGFHNTLVRDFLAGIPGA